MLVNCYQRQARCKSEDISASEKERREVVNVRSSGQLSLVSLLKDGYAFKHERIFRKGSVHQNNGRVKVG